MPRTPAVCILATCVLFPSVALSDGPPLIRLEVGKPVERPARGGTSDFTEFLLPQGGFARVRVDQRNAGVRVSVLDPGGREIDWTDETGAFDAEFISVVGGPAGVYRLEVRDLGPPEHAGPVVVTLLAARPGLPGDAGHIAADLQFRQANVQRRQQDAPSLRRAIDRFTEAIALYHAAGDRVREGESENRRAKVQLDLDDHAAALTGFRRAQAIFQQLGDRKWLGITTHNIGKVHLARGEVVVAMELLERALLIRRELGDRDGESYTLFQLGRAWAALGETERAIELLQQTVDIHVALYDLIGIFESLITIADLEAARGSFQKALEKYDEVVERAPREARNPQRQALTLARQGKARVYLSLGDLDGAQAESDRALEIARALDNKNLMAGSLELAGELQLAGGQPRRAIETLAESRALRQAASDRSGEARTLGRIGGALAQLGDHAGALARFDEALALNTAVGNKLGMASTLLLASGEHDSQGRFAEARTAAGSALALYRGAGDRMGEGNALYQRARAQRGLGLVGEALESVGGAIERFESLRSLLDSPELRTMWRATTRGAFELQIELLMKAHEQSQGAGFDVRALLANERALARGLLESLGSGRAGLRQDASQALLARRSELARKANALEFQRVRSLADSTLPKPRDAELAAVLEEVRALDGRILAASPRYAAITLPPSLSLADVQRLLDVDTLLIEFALGEQRSFAWVVSTEGVRNAVLPARAEIEAKARALRAACTARNDAVADPTVAQRRARMARADAAAATSAAALSRVILGPLAGALGGRRLVIVGDGALRLVPFAALPDPDAPRSPLGARHELASLPSAAVLAELRRWGPQRPAPSDKVVVLADPVFEGSDPRVHGAAASAVAAGKPGAAAATSPEMVASRTALVEVSRAAADSGLAGFPRLRFSRQEADAVTALAPGRTLAAVDFAASRETATSEELAHARVVHFATHSLMNAAHPALSGLVLSLLDEHGRPRDGFLRLHEIYNLDLRADLVVLSACQTAVGKEWKGEGMVALTRGFLAAGAPRVVASLWNVDDRATAELMKRFYQGVLGRKLTPAAALREAQLQVAADPRWRAPYYWAGFGLQGDWR